MRLAVVLAIVLGGSLNAQTIVSDTNLKAVSDLPGLKGDTATRALKAATIETGATVMVPLFVDQDELIRVNTKSGDYVERVKE